MPSDPRPVSDRFEEPRDDPRFAAVFGRHLEELNQRGFIDPDEILTLYPDLGPAVVEDLETYIQLRPEGEAEPGGAPLGDYTLNQQIGRGGMGVVYEAWQGSMNRRVALKVLPVGAAADPRTFHRFMREAQAAGKLTHPHVVPVFGVGLEQQTPYYAMEYVEGATLGQVLGKMRDGEDEAESPFGKRSEQQFYLHVARAFADVADGLQHAHAKGVIHRDVKPSNLILDFEGRLRILDFGLAQLEGQESLTLSGDVVGTPSYMSPEQARAKRVAIDHRTDVYSLGATMYEALTLKPPFKGKSHQDILSQIIERDPAEPRKSNPRIPFDLETIVLKCLRKDPADRYGTAEALGQDLRRFLRGDAIEARPRSGLEKFGKRLWLHRGMVAASILILLLTIAGLAVSNTLIARARDEARHDLYVSDMRLAMEDFDAGSTGRFSQLLERHIPGPGEPDLRGWEWYYLRSLREDASLATFKEESPVSCVGWSVDGRFVAAGHKNGSVKVWDVKSEELVDEWKKEGKWRKRGIVARRLAWGPTSAQSQLLAVRYNTGAIEVRDVFSGAAIQLDLGISKGPSWRRFDWSGDGRWLAVSTDEELQIWASDSWRKVRKIQAKPATVIAWSPDERHLVAVQTFSGKTHVIDTVSGVERSYTTAELFPGHPRRVTAFAWSPDGAALAFASVDGRIRIASVEGLDLEPHASLDAGAVPYDLAWSHDELGPRLAAACGDRTIKVWDLSRGESRVTLRGMLGKVMSLAWDPTGRRLVSGSENGEVKIWEPRRRPAGVSYSRETHAIWSPDGRWLAVEDGTASLSVVEVATGATVFERAMHANFLSFSPDSRRLVAGSTRYFDSTGELRPEDVGSVELWDLQEDPQLVHRLRAPFFQRCASWHPNGELLATGHKGACVVWDTSIGKPLKTLKTEPQLHFTTIAWSPDSEGAWLAAMSARVLKIWDTRTWEEVLSTRRPGSGVTLYGDMACSFSADGRYFAAGGLLGQVTIWSAGSWDDPRDFSGHRATVTSVSWHPDGTRLATGSEDRTIRIWNTETGEQLLTLHGHEGFINSMMWHPDGQRLLSTAGHRDSLKIWDARPGYDRGDE